MEKKIEVVMLTTDCSKLIINKKGVLWGDSESGCKSELSFPQHLYFLSSDDEIKEGAYFYDLEVNQVFKQSGSLSERVVMSSHNSHYINNTEKIISSTDKSLGLPEPSKEWIEYFVSEYNKGNIITEVMVEYEKSCNCIVLADCYNPDSSICDEKHKLKIKPDNTIICSAVEETWTDVYFKYDSFKFHHPKISFVQWLKDNNYQIVKTN